MRLRSAMTRPRRLAAVACAVLLTALCTGAGASAAELRTPGPVPVKIDGDQFVSDLTSGVLADDLARALVGPDATISGAIFKGDPRAAGLVSGFLDSVGIESGVVLSSGAITNSPDGAYASSIAGPNMVADNTMAFGTPGDLDLDQLVAPQITYDAAALEFDFEMPATDLAFNFVFGSDEYPNYAGAGFNDAFAFYLDGVNCATVPDPSGGGGVVPVSVDTVNRENNSGLYRSNAQSDLPPTPLDTELGGLTTTLTCRMHVSPGTTHHLKLVIADTGDAQWDSAVLVQGGTATPVQPPVAEDQSVTVPVGTPTDITLTGQDGDGDDLTFAIAVWPKYGKLDGVPPYVTYSADDGFDGVDSFTFTVDDGMATSAPGNVAILVTDQTQTPTQTPTESPSPPGTPTDPPTSSVPAEPPVQTTTAGQTAKPSHSAAGRDRARASTTPSRSATGAGTLSGTGIPNSTPWLGAAGVSGLLAGLVLIMTARRRLAR